MIATANSTKAAPALPKGWRWVKLGEVCEVISGTTPKSGTSKYWNGEIIWITPTDLGKLHARYMTNSERKISTAGFQSCNLTMASVGSVVLSSRAPIGHLGIAAVPLCTNQGCKTFMPGGEVESEFLYHALKRSVWKLQQMGSGATFAEVSKTQLEAFKIPLPPLPEQKRIASILNEQMSVVENARKAAEERLAAVNALPSAYLRAVFPAPDQPLPEGWRWVKLGEVCEKHTGIRQPRTEPDKEFQYVDISSVDTVQKHIVTAKTLMGKDAPSRARQIILEKDVIVSTTRPNLNAVAIVPTQLNNQICSTGFCVLRATKLIAPEFLFLFVLHEAFVEALSDLVKGALYPAVNDKQVKAQIIPLPPLPEQKRIASILNEQMAAVTLARKTAEEELATIKALPAALLRQAFAGEL